MDESCDDFTDSEGGCGRVRGMKELLWRSVVLVVLVLAALVAIVMVWRSSGDTVVFTVVDGVDGRFRLPLTNATVRVRRRWTTLPVEKLGVGLSS